MQYPCQTGELGVATGQGYFVFTPLEFNPFHTVAVVRFLGLVYPATTHRYLLSVQFNLQFSVGSTHGNQVVLLGYLGLWFHIRAIVTNFSNK